MSKETVNETTALNQHDVTPAVGIITALPQEYAAVKALLESQRSVIVSGRGAGRQYLYTYGELPASNGRRHHIVLALLPDMGNNHASSRAALLSEHFPSMQKIFMVGIAGGIPHPDKPAEHVRLGDIVVSGREGVIQYDLGKEELRDNEIEFTPRPPPRPPSASMLEIVRHLDASELAGERPWDRYIDQGLKSLSAARPSEKTDVLVSSSDPSKRISHPIDPKRVNDLPRVFVGPIASSNTLLKNPLRRDRLRDQFGVKAVEMEGSGIADAAWELEIQYVVIRAICDYCDSRKGDEWQPYAAVAAAAYTRALLEATPAANSTIIEGAQTHRPESIPSRAEEEFRYHTERAIKRARIEITGLTGSFRRDEIDRIEDQLMLGNCVIMKGEPGTGKTGIGRNLAEDSLSKGKVVLFLDAKQFRRVTSEKELRDRLESVEPLATLIARLGRERGFRLIIDQIDNVVGLDVAKVLVDLAIDCNGLLGVEVVVIGRDRETHESDILQRIAEDGFVELESYPLTKEKAEESLNELGIPNPPQKLIDLSRNLLNLELIATIKVKQPSFDFSNILDEVALWDTYLNVLRRREEEGADLSAAEQTVTEAIRLAKLVVGREEQTFSLDSPLAVAHRRLESWGIIVKEEGLIYRFQHEQFQDYLFASDAVDHLKMPQEVMKEINFLRNRNIFLWMTKIYAHRKSSRRKEFLRKALLDV